MKTRNSEPGKDSNNTRKFCDTELGKPRLTAVAQAVSIALIASIAPGPLFAQDQPLDEIIVSATKRAESVMDVPIAITAMTGEAIREANLNDVKDLIQFTPGVSGNSKDSFIDFVSIRGIRTIDFGNGGDPSVSFYKNGLYQGRTGSVVSSLYDIERSEVLRGPQGFLYGRGSVHQGSAALEPGCGFSRFWPAWVCTSWSALPSPSEWQHRSLSCLLP